MSEDPIHNRDDGYYRSSTTINPSSLNRSGRLIVPQQSSRPQQARAPFQQVMDQIKWSTNDNLASRQPLASPEPTRETQEKAVEKVITSDHQDQPRSFREELERRTREPEKKPENKRSESGSTEAGRGKGKTAEQRVVARGPLSERQRDGQNKGGNKDNSNPWQGNKFKTFISGPELKSLQKGKIQELGQAAFQLEMKKFQAQMEKKEHTPTVFSKELLDQIVQYVRLLTKVDGEKEMDVSLHEKVFKGLRLRIAMKQEKADVSFMTQSEEVRELFLAHKRDLESALKEKGIEVGLINVIMI